MPLSGVPCFPFYRPRESMGYSRRKEENKRERERKSFRDTAGGDRYSPTLGTCLLDDAMPYQYQRVITSHSTLAGGAVNQHADQRPYRE